MSAREPAVESKADHVPQPAPVAVEQGREGLPVARLGPAQQIVGLDTLAAHHVSSPPPHLSGKGGPLSTGGLLFSRAGRAPAS